jgi:hypothetical protein
MCNTRSFLLLAAILAFQPAFAIDSSCVSIAESCVKAGYVKMDAGDKNIWKNCMKPVLLNQSVNGVTVDPTTAKSCRDAKVQEMKSDLDEFQKLS